jgi:hypothetical protein
MGEYPQEAMARTDTDPPRRNGKPTATRKGGLDRSRDAVMADFRRIAGPLRGRNRGQKPKA